MLGTRLTLFELFGFKVRVDASWLLLAVLIVWSLAVGYFPAMAPGWEPATYWAMGVVGLLGLALSVVVHELAHALVARRFDMPIAGITLFVFGGVAEMSREPSTARGEFLMAIVGPLMSLAVAGVFHLAVALAEGLGAGPANPAVAVLGYLAFLNLLLAGFNMIPAFPLDGGRVLRAVLWAWRKDLVWATWVATGCGSLFGMLLAGWGLLLVLQGYITGGLWWILIGLFVRAAAAGAYREVRGNRLSGHPVAKLMNIHPVTVAPDVTIERLVEEYFYLHPHTCFPVVAGGVLLGCVDMDALGRVARHEWRVRTVAEVMQDCAAATLPDTADAAEALARMRRTGRSRMMITHGGQLVGILSLTDLLGSLSLDPKPSM
jgi:Zn-dependent protease/predicted transcriptional regulator